MRRRWYMGVLVGAAIGFASGAAAEPAKPAAPLLGGDVERFAEPFNRAAARHGSTLRLVAAGCVRAAGVTCTYTLGKVGLVAAAEHGRPLSVLMYVAGADADPLDVAMAALLTMSVFSPEATRPQLQEHFKRLMAGYEAKAGASSSVLVDGVEYKLSNGALGVMLVVARK